MALLAWLMKSNRQAAIIPALPTPPLHESDNEDVTAVARPNQEALLACLHKLTEQVRTNSFATSKVLQWACIAIHIMKSICACSCNRLKLPSKQTGALSTNAVSHPPCPCLLLPVFRQAMYPLFRPYQPRLLPSLGVEGSCRMTEFKGAAQSLHQSYSLRKTSTVKQ